MVNGDQLVITDHQRLLNFTVSCLLKTGFNREKADLIGHSLIEADLRGLNTHGVIRIPMYLNRVRAGLIDPGANPQVVVETESTAVLDGANGMGQVSSTMAMNLAINKAEQSIVSLVGVRNSNHFGAAAFYSMMAVEKHMIGFCASNTEPLMPATGGVSAVLGNNPLSLAIPAGKRMPIVLDMATSAAAIGKIMLARKKGVPIPLGWATDCKGENTTDPDKALGGGLILPLGGPKGFGLSIVIDVLAGVLMGSGFGSGVKSPLTDMVNKQRAGHVFGALKISGFMPVDMFRECVDSLIGEIKESPRASGVEEIFLPGEIEYGTRQKRLSEGIPLPGKLIKDLEEYGEELGVKEKILG